MGKPWLFGLHQCSHARIWTTEEQRLFTEIGHRIADGLSSLLSLRDLRESETRFRDLAELLPQTVFEIDLEGRFTFLSRLAFETFGYSPEELSCLSAVDVFLPEERERIQRNLRKRIQGDTFWDHQYTALRKDGTTFPSLVYSTPIIRDGVAVGLRGILVDITERQYAEQALQESKAKLESILESSPNAIIVLDLEARITDCNQATLDMHGLAAKDEVLGRSAFDFVAEKKRPKTREYLQTILQQGAIKDVEVTLLKRDGREFPAEVSVRTMTDPSGHPIGLVATAADITQRKCAEQALQESEQKYRSVVEDSPGLICTFRPNGELTFVNDAYCQYFGHAREELLGKPFAPLIPDEDREQVMAAITGLTSEAPVQTHEHRVIVPGGESALEPLDRSCHLRRGRTCHGLSGLRRRYYRTQASGTGSRETDSRPDLPRKRDGRRRVRGAFRSGRDTGTPGSLFPGHRCCLHHHLSRRHSHHQAQQFLPTLREYHP